MIKGIFLATVFFTIAISISAQYAVDINLNVKHVVGETSEFDRSKYIIIHDDLTGNEWESDAVQRELLEDYDVYFGRNNGYIVWEYNNTKEDADKKGWPDVDHMISRGTNSKNDYAGKSFVHQFENRYENMMIGGQEHMFPHGQSTSIGGLVYDGYEATAEFYANYLKHYFGEGGSTGRPAPKMLEVINEPFVKANQLGTTREEMAKYHNVIAERVKELNPEIMVGGYTAAHPAFEDNNFGHWDGNWRMFIDEAGKNMDFFSFHLYDFVQEKTDMDAEMYRSGSNIEAIMDMINHYSYLSLGETKPWSLSEYGWLCNGCKEGYDAKEDWYNIRSFNNMMVQLMERPDQIVNAIPFMLLKASWAKPADSEYNTYGPRLLREIGEVEGEPEHGGWVFTELLQYFQLWANVKGTRVDTKANDQDLLADAYIDGNKMYLILSNLEKGEQKVQLKAIEHKSNVVESIMVKHSYAVDDFPVLDTVNFAQNISEFTIGSQATAILEYTFANELVIDESNNETTYFADKYLQEIKAMNPITFNLNGIVKQDNGEAILRLGMGRSHGLTLNPILKVNGTMVNVPTDWRGYNQKTRNSFFGVIEIAVPYELLKENNEITMYFTDAGGFVTSASLQVFNFSTQIERFLNPVGVSDDQSYHNFSVYPNPAKSQITLNNLIGGNINYNIHDLNGKLVSSGLVSEQANTISISQLDSGLYFVSIQDNLRKRVLKFVKE